MSKANLVQKRVEMLLRGKPSLRNSDFLLINDYIDIYCVTSKDTSFNDVLVNHKLYKVPSFEAITRARRKVQEKYPELKAVEEVEEERRNIEESFRLEYGTN